MDVLMGLKSAKRSALDKLASVLRCDPIVKEVIVKKTGLPKNPTSEEVTMRIVEKLALLDPFLEAPWIVRKLWR